MSTSGPRYTGTGANYNDGGLTAWTNPTNIEGDTTSTAATCSIGTNNNQSQRLRCSNFGFSIDAGATIDGITVEVEQSSANNNRQYWYSVQALVSGSESGNNNSDGSAINTTKAFKTFGGASDTWGISPTPTIVNNSGFGVSLKINRNSSSSTTTSLYRCRITITYRTQFNQSITATATMNLTVGGSLVKTQSVNVGLTASAGLARLTKHEVTPPVTAGVQVEPTYISGGQEFYKTIDIALDAGADVSRNTGKTADPTVALVASVTRLIEELGPQVVREVRKVTSPDVTWTVLLERYFSHGAQQFEQAIDAAVSLAASLQRQTQKLGSVLVSATATLSRRIGKINAPAVTAGITLVRATAKQVAASVTVGLQQSATKVKVLALNVAVTLTATVRRATGKVASPALTLTANLARQTRRVVSSAVAVGASVARAVRKDIAAAVTATITLTRIKAKQVALNVAMTMTAAVSRRAGKQIAAAVGVTVARIQQVRHIVSVPATIGVELTRAVVHRIAVSVTAAVQRISGKGTAHAIDVPVSFTSTLRRETGKITRPAVSLAVAISRQIGLVARAIIAQFQVDLESIQFTPTSEINVGVTLTVQVDRQLIRYPTEWPVSTEGEWPVSSEAEWPVLAEGEWPVSTDTEWTEETGPEWRVPIG